MLAIGKQRIAPKGAEPIDDEFRSKGFIGLDIESGIPKTESSNTHPRRVEIDRVASYCGLIHPLSLAPVTDAHQCAQSRVVVLIAGEIRSQKRAVPRREMMIK